MATASATRTERAGGDSIIARYNPLLSGTLLASSTTATNTVPCYGARKVTFVFRATSANTLTSITPLAILYPNGTAATGTANGSHTNANLLVQNTVNGKDMSTGGVAIEVYSSGSSTAGRILVREIGWSIVAGGSDVTGFTLDAYAEF